MAAEFVAESTYKTNYSGPLRFILSHVRRHPLVAVLLVVGAAGNAALAAVVPKFLGLAFNAMTEAEGGDLGYVALIGVAIIVSQIVRGVVQLARNFAAATFAQRIERDVRDELYASLLGKNMRFHDLMPVGEIMARVTNDVRELNLMMYPGVNLLVGSGMFLLAPVITASRDPVFSRSPIRAVLSCHCV